MVNRILVQLYALIPEAVLLEPLWTVDILFVLYLPFLLIYLQGRSN